MVNCHFKGLYEILLKNKVLLSSIFLFSFTALWVLFLFSYKSVSKFWKTDNISSASFHYIYKSEENLKILEEILRQKLIVSNVILTIWNLKFSSSSNNGGRHRAPPFFKISGSASGCCLLFSVFDLQVLSEKSIWHLMLVD